ncbi:MAG: hypothetical protein A2W04_01335 [Betaproteobacteria bacterium RBG_16_64_9]|nr:MAG: hypothetical protein A2W04_01335 [Betaproteobacteria bacterium RBG_16_64_9]
MEPLPRGANFIRAKFLWEIGLHIAGNPLTPYTGPRDVCITVGSGSGEHYRPWLRMSSGSPILARAVAHGELEMAIVNPSGLLTQAYRGTGLFAKPLPLRVIATYPSWDRFVILVHPRTGITSLAQIKEKRLPLRLSTREDPTHSTRVLIDQMFGLYGFSLAEIESWGGTLQLNGPPMDKRRLDALREETLDIGVDEGIGGWFDFALACGMRPLTLEDQVFRKLIDIGWRRVVIPPGIFPQLSEEYACIDYSGWPLYANASLPDEDAYKVVEAIHAREDQIAWEASKPWAPYQGMQALGEETESTPRDVPLHPGAAKWFGEHGFKV